MPIYTYSYRDIHGTLLEDKVHAPNKHELTLILKKKGINPVEIQLFDKRSKRHLDSKVKMQDVSVFCRQFSTMLDAGVPLVKALDILAKQVSDKKFALIIQDMKKKVEEGESLSNTMQLFPNVFNPLFVGLIRAGEVGGVLDKVLASLSEFLEKEIHLRRKVKSSMTYPMIVLSASIGVVIFLVSYVVPKFVELFDNMNMEHSQFPKTTQFIINLSDIINNHWVSIIISLFGLAIIYNKWKKTRSGKSTLDYLKLKLPVFGNLTLKVILARYSRTLSTLLGAGVPILQAMETVAGTVNNTHLSKTILDSRKRIMSGESLSSTIEDSEYFPPILVHMILVGEESGSLDFMLKKVADFYDDEVDTALASLTSALEPILILFLAFIVGFIVIAMFTPSLQVMNGLSEGAMG